mgnify:CR=1 FL=1
MTATSNNEKVDKFSLKLNVGFPHEAGQLRELVSRTSALSFYSHTGKSETNLHIKNVSGVNFGCFQSSRGFRNYSFRLTGEQFLDDFGLVLGFPVSKEGSEHFGTVHEEGSKSIPLDYFLKFENEWFAMVTEWLKKHA